MRLAIMIPALLMTCAEPSYHECAGWEKRECVCPSGEKGSQRCSRGEPFGDKGDPRTWLFCSCCFETKKDQYGVYRYDTDPASGCWNDIYDPSATDLEETN